MHVIVAQASEEVPPEPLVFDEPSPPPPPEPPEVPFDVGAVSCPAQLGSHVLHACVVLSQVFVQLAVNPSGHVLLAGAHEAVSQKFALHCPFSHPFGQLVSEEEYEHVPPEHVPAEEYVLTLPPSHAVAGGLLHCTLAHGSTGAVSFSA